MVSSLSRSCEPERTCVACRKKASKSILKRFVADAGGKLVIDELHQLPGRGAYLHAHCIERMGVSDKAKEKLMFSLNKQSLKKVSV